MANDATGQFRLFVACELPDEVKSALGGVQDDLRRLDAARLRWVRPEGIHVTLKFLGGVEANRVEGITSALAAAVEPFELRLWPASVGRFGGARLRVVWVGLEGDTGGLATQAERVERALQPLGFPGERRPFAAHVTLARVPDQASPAERQRVAGVIERYRPPAFPSMTLTSVSLMRSHLGPGGASYERLASFPQR
jgi:2'-5' RNA ligase